MTNMNDITDLKKEKDLECLDDVQQSAITNHDDVFGEISEGGPNYRSVRLFTDPPPIALGTYG